jgi:hypothetical protein
MAGTPEPTIMKYPSVMQYQGVLVRFVPLVIDSIILAVILGILGAFFGVFNNIPSTFQDVFLYYGADFNLFTFIIYIGLLHIPGGVQRIDCGQVSHEDKGG